MKLFTYKNKIYCIENGNFTIRMNCNHKILEIIYINDINNECYYFYNKKVVKKNKNFKKINKNIDNQNFFYINEISINFLKNKFNLDYVTNNDLRNFLYLIDIIIKKEYYENNKEFLRSIFLKEKLENELKHKETNKQFKI